MSLLSTQRTYETFFDVKLKNRKEGTRKNYRLALTDFDKFCNRRLDNSLENLIPEFRNASTENIIDTLQSWINDSKIQSNLNQRGRMSQINSYLYYRGVKIDSRDMKDLEYENSIQEERQPITDEDLVKILDSANPILKTLCFTLSSSGMRIGECCHLIKSDFDLTQKRIAIKIKPSYTKKNSCGRTVYVSREAEKYLKPKLAKLEDNELVFNTSPSIPLTIINLTVQFRRLIDKIDLNKKYESGTRQKTLHALRAYFFTKAVQKHGLGYAHKMTGHKGHLEEYNRYTDEQKLKMYLELEPDLFVYEAKPPTEEIMKMREELDETKAEMKKYKESYDEFQKLSTDKEFRKNQLMPLIENIKKRVKEELREEMISELKKEKV